MQYFHRGKQNTLQIYLKNIWKFSHKKTFIEKLKRKTEMRCEETGNCMDLNMDYLVKIDTTSYRIFKIYFLDWPDQNVVTTESLFFKVRNKSI